MAMERGQGAALWEQGVLSVLPTTLGTFSFSTPIDDVVSASSETVEEWGEPNIWGGPNWETTQCVFQEFVSPEYSLFFFPACFSSLAVRSEDYDSRFWTGPWQ